MSSNIRNILFRADSSSTIGIGHIMRDLVLAKQYPEANITFATQDLNGNINHKIIEAGYKLEILKSDDLSELEELIKKLAIDMIVIDHYGIDYNFEEQLKNKNPTLKIMVLDDTYEKHHCDILLNHNIYGDETKYKELVPQNCELRCGSKFTLLRDEFIKENIYIIPKNTSNITNVFVSLGGVDSKNLNLQILEILNEYTNFTIDIVTTTSNKELDKLQKYVSNYTNISLHINTNEIAKLMSQCDFAIVTPSVTANEICFMNIPFVAIKTEDNQNNMYEYLKLNNYFVLEEFEIDSLKQSINLLMNVQKINLIPFQNLTLKEKEMVLSWRNDDLVRKWMFNQEYITLDKHLDYIESLASRIDRLYFLAKIQDEYFGVVDLTNIMTCDRAELGIYVKPNTHGNGKVLMHKIIQFAFQDLKINKLLANVYKSNKNAIKLYKKFNFITVSNDKDKNGDLLKMELKK